MKLNTKDYLYWGRWLQPVLSWSFWEYWSLSKSAKNIPLELSYEIIPTLNIDGHHYIKLNKFYYNLVDEFLLELLSDKKPLLEYFFKEAEKTDKNIANFLENNEYKNDFDKIKNTFDLHRDVMFSWAVIVPLDYAINKKSEELCEKYKLSWDKVTNSVSLPFELLSFKDNEKLFEFKKALKEINFNQQASVEQLLKKNESLAKEIINYQKRTEYVGTHHFWGTPRKIEDLMIAISNSSLHNLEEVRERPGNIPEELLHVAEIGVAVSTWRIQIAERVAQLEYSIREELTRLANKLSITYEDIIFLTDKEIIDIFEKDSLASEMKLEIKERKNKFAGTMSEKGELIVWTGKGYFEIEKEFIKKDEKVEDVLELKGLIGNSGKVRGEVSIVLGPKDMQKVKKDSVLVSPATSPDYFSVMKLAKAIVTDEGGITSHAAIVAREMKKPCIIGTKIATQVLKDGDEVEVDAEKGIVKILKRK